MGNSLEEISCLCKFQNRIKKQAATFIEITHKYIDAASHVTDMVVKEFYTKESWFIFFDQGLDIWNRLVGSIM